MCGKPKTPEIKPTADMQAQQEVNAKMFNYYMTDFKPLVERYSKDATSPAIQEAEKRQVAGRINADVMKNVSGMKVSENPVVNVKGASDVAQMATRAQVEGEGKVRSRQIGDVQNVINIGRGEATTAQAGLDAIADQSVGKEINRVAMEQEADAAQENAVGSLIGTGAAALLYKSDKKK
jgi:hypothetical protein